jgi:hypothetical protein
MGQRLFAKDEKRRTKVVKIGFCSAFFVSGHSGDHTHNGIKKLRGRLWLEETVLPVRSLDCSSAA